MRVSESEQRDGCFIYLVIVIGLLIYALSGCGRSVQYVPVETVRIDSISVRDTTYLTQLVPYRDSVQVADTVSYLSNEYAYSWARWQDGRLHHSLGIWPFATIRVQVPYYIDRYVYRSEPQIVEVEKKLSRWQKIKLEIGGLAIGALLALIVYLIVRKYCFKIIS